MRNNIFPNILIFEILGIIHFFNKGQKSKALEMEEEYKNNLICRFVLDGTGNKVGESVAIEKDLLIIKSKNTYLGVPLKHIEEDGKTIIVKGLIDRDNAEMMGEVWRNESFKEIKYDNTEEKDEY
jgi:hypothetical protein